MCQYDEPMWAFTRVLRNEAMSTDLGRYVKFIERNHLIPII